jgi:succinoglycan biosynthesis protein ExoM
MHNGNNHISVCICTYKRPTLLLKLLEELQKQNTEGLYTYSIIVSDNDSAQSAKKVVLEFSGLSQIEITYCVEPRQNIALARNLALKNATGDYIAFIDDDEFPENDWLLNLIKTCNACGADGVLGPVKPYFNFDPPDWVKKGKYFDRPTHETGYRISLSDARTGNVMLKSRIIDRDQDPFRSEFGTGGEDVDFFRRMFGKGFIFVWCNEAVVYESVPLVRCNRRYLFRRALLRGRNSYKQTEGQVSNLLKSLAAVLVYCFMLLFIFAAGDRLLMTYLIKICYHSGRLLASIGFSFVKER